MALGLTLFETIQQSKPKQTLPKCSGSSSCALILRNNPFHHFHQLLVFFHIDLIHFILSHAPTGAAMIKHVRKSQNPFHVLRHGDALDKRRAQCEFIFNSLWLKGCCFSGYLPVKLKGKCKVDTNEVNILLGDNWFSWFGLTGH